MSQRLLVIDPVRCDGCRHCETTCAAQKTGLPADQADPAASRIQIYHTPDGRAQDRYLPVACQQCEDAPCLAACPKEAITRDEISGWVQTDYDRCVACRMCFFACPFGAIGFDAETARVFKCDLCAGQPACIPVCAPGALYLAERYRLGEHRRRQTARRSTGLRR